MKLIKLYLLALCLCLPNLLLAQEINLLLEEQLEELADDDETVNYDDLLQELSQPIDLNNATKEQLERLPFLSDQQIENILAYIYVHGPMQTMYESDLIFLFISERAMSKSIWVRLNTTLYAISLPMAIMYRQVLRQKKMLANRCLSNTINMATIIMAFMLCLEIWGE